VAKGKLRELPLVIGVFNWGTVLEGIFHISFQRGSHILPFRKGKFSIMPIPIGEHRRCVVTLIRKGEKDPKPIIVSFARGERSKARLSLLFGGQKERKTSGGNQNRAGKGEQASLSKPSVERVVGKGSG